MDSYMGNKKKRPRITEFASQIFHSSTAVSKLDSTMHRSFTIPPNSSDLSINEDEADTGVLRKKCVQFEIIGLSINDNSSHINLNL